MADTVVRSTKLTAEEWEHLDVLAEVAGESAHGYVVRVLQDHLEANPIDAAVLRELERTREDFARRLEKRLARGRRKTHSHGENGLISPTSPAGLLAGRAA